MSEEEAQITTTEETPASTSEETPAPTTEETPAPTTEETPASTSEETPASTTEETPASTTEETATETPAGDDQPAVTEVTEVTPAEGDAEQPKEETPKEEEKKEEVKAEPKVVDYRTSKAGWVQKQGLLFKKWQRQWMSLDEEDSVLRWWKNENRKGSDRALYSKYIADVSNPKAEATTRWPDNTADRCFVVCSPYRAFYLVAETPEEKNDWVQKLTAAKEKYNTENRKVISTDPLSLEGFKASLSSREADAEKTINNETKKDEEKTEDAPATEGEQATPAEDSEAVAAVTVEVDVETPTTEESPKAETPAVEASKDGTPAEEPPKDEPPAEEPPKEEEPPKDETPVAAEEGESETKAED